MDARQAWRVGQPAESTASTGSFYLLMMRKRQVLRTVEDAELAVPTGSSDSLVEEVRRTWR